MARVSIREQQAIVRRAVARRTQALKDKAWPKARSALAVARRARRAIQSERAARNKRAKCPRVDRVYHSSKNFDARPPITPRYIVLHSTESGPGSGKGVSEYLARGSTQADIHRVIDTKGEHYRLVPDGRKAWHVAESNGFTLGIEQVGRAAQNQWPEAQLREVARQIACWSRKYDIPIRDGRNDRGFTARGVVDHNSLPGDHWDPGPAYPFARVLKLAREYL